MGAVWLWASRDLRRRWRSVVVLAVLAALGGGLAITAAVGAKRSRSVIAESMRERRQPDAMSIPSRPELDWRGVVGLPYVTAHGTYGDTALCVSEAGGLTFSGTGLCTTPPLSGGWFDSISRVDIDEGRMADAADETVVNGPAAEKFGLRVGQTIHLEGIAKRRPLAVPDSLGPLDDYWNNRPQGPLPWGPAYPVRIVGTYEGEDAQRLINGGVEDPHLILPEAFMETHRDELDYRVDTYFRLAGGAADVDRLRREIAGQLGPEVPTTDVHNAQERVERSTTLESNALWACAIAIAALTLVLVGQALARLIRAGASGAASLRALGMSRRGAVVALAAPGLLVALAGSLGAVAVAAATSPAVPLGVARSFDRHPGVKLDAAVTATGAAAVSLLVVAIAVGTAWLAMRGEERPGSARRRGARGGWAAGLPPPVRIGLGWALGDRGDGAGLARSALITAVVGVAAIVAALTIRAGVDDALAEPQRAGMVWDFLVETPETSSPDSFFEQDPDVAGASSVSSRFVTFQGRPVRGYVARPLARPLEFVTLEGRLPQDPDEVAVGPATARDLGVSVGDALPGGPEGNHPYRVVGEALFPNLSGRESYDEGAWLTGAGMRRIEPGPGDLEEYFVKLRDGADESEFGARIERLGGSLDRAQAVEPAGIVNLHNIRGLPLLLIAFFAVLACGAIAHALVTTVRRRRRDLAVLRSLGMSRRQTRAVVGTQATALAVVGTLVGAPIGLAGGLLAWHWVASNMPLVYVAPLAILAIVLVGLAAVVLVNVLALLPGRAAARAHPAAALRAE